MALADYFGRAAMAADQVLGTHDPRALKRQLNDVSVGVAFSSATAKATEGAALLDLLVRLLARLYPSLALLPGRGADSAASQLASLALAVNPKIDLKESFAGDNAVYVIIGDSAPNRDAGTKIFCSSRNWTGYVSSSTLPEVGPSTNPIGPGIAACLAAANVFRRVFLPADSWRPDVSAEVSGLPHSPETSLLPSEVGDVPLAGVGAIGNAAAWALARLPLKGKLYLVDPERIELSNLQRYVLASRSDVRREKATLAAEHLTADLVPRPHRATWAEFVQTSGYGWQRVLVALDTARDRRTVQASLPRWIANAWTQPGDLGVSVNRFGSGACLSCLYLPQTAVASEDQLVAEALGVPDQVPQIRGLLYHNQPAPPELLDLIAERLSVSPALVHRFSNRPVRSLYVRGICGGTVLPSRTEGAASTHADMHVPLAHQSALGGVLLAAALAGEALGQTPSRTSATRIDLMRPVGAYLTQPVEADSRSICICQDADFRAVYESKWSQGQVG